MATGKNSFVLYKNYNAMAKELTDEQAGRLFKAILAYVNGEDLPDLSMIEKVAYTFIVSQIDADTVKYEKRIEANRQNGARGGRPPKYAKTEEKPNNPLGYEKDEKEGTESGKKPSGRASRKEYTPEFEELWSAYPNKDDKWNGFLKYQARRKKYTHEQLLSAARNYIERKKRDRDYPKYVKQLQTFFSNDMADFTQYIGTSKQAQSESEDDWASYFAGGTE